MQSDKSKSQKLTGALRRFIKSHAPYKPVILDSKRAIPFSWIKGKMEILTEDSEYHVQITPYNHLQYHDFEDPTNVQILKDNIVALRKYCWVSKTPMLFSLTKVKEIANMLKLYTNDDLSSKQIMHFIQGETIHLTTSKLETMSPVLNPEISVRKFPISTLRFIKVRGLFEIRTDRNELLGHSSHDIGTIRMTDPSYNWDVALTANHNEITSENTSNSASLSLHQTATIAFSMSLGFNFSIEEIRHGHRFDSIIRQSDTCEILLDTTTSNTRRKVEKLLNKVNSSCSPIVSINKYMIPYVMDDSTVSMINLSYATDICDTSYIQSKINNQMRFLNRNEGSQASFHSTFDRRIAEHMKDKESVRNLGKLAQQVLVERVQDSVSKSIQVDQNISAISETVLDIREDLMEVWSHHFLKDKYNVVSRSKPHVFYEMSTSESSYRGNYLTVGSEIKTQTGITLDPIHHDQEGRIMYWTTNTKALLAPHELNSEIKSLVEDRDYVLAIINSDARPEYKEYLLKPSIKRVLKLDDMDSVIPIVREYNYDMYTFRKLHREKATDVSNRVEGIPLDPLDVRPICSAGIPNLKKLIQTSKYYHELRIKQKISHAAMNLRDDQCVVLRAELEGLSIVMHARGLIRTTDSGVLFVSYAQDGKLVRFEKWRQPDIARFLVAKNQFISCVVSAAKHCSDKHRESMIDLYGALIYENSWGVSKLLKPFRYLITGHFFNSPLLYEQFKKVKKELLDDSGKVKAMYMKPSLRLLFNLYQPQTLGKGPLFNLPESQIGYEAFLVNLCPPETYGKRRHRVNVLKELYSEINLSIQHERDVLELHSHYVETLGEPTIDKVREHFDMIDRLAIKTDGRFTYSPISIDMMSTHLDNLMDTVRSFNGTLPTLSSLSTMKASYCPVKVKACKAMESMRNLVQHHECPSVKQLAFSILEASNFVDLSMRMFDKDQVGGDREISILSSQFRILQSITEKLSKKLGSYTGIDMLANKDKEVILTQHYVKTLSSEVGMMLTVDQTRWGPNFNTTLFGYMMTYLSNHSTEFFIPMLTCFMSEFKIFESLPYPELKEEATESYTLCGRLGKYHMAQGIFHYTSSLYHSMVVKVMSSVLTECIKEPGMDVEINHMVTSDDLATFISCNSSDEAVPISDEIKSEIKIKIGKFLFSATRCFFRYFNIKSSDYKNMASEKLVEFNSIFLAPESVGSNSLKFTNSLISPKTTGDVILDYRSVMSSYSDGINSGLTDSEAYLVYYMNLCLLCLRWGLDVRKVPILQHKILKRGLKPKVDLIPEAVLQHRPVLKSETYQKMNSIALELSEMSSDPISKGIFKVMSDNLRNAQRLAGPLRAVYLQRKIAERYEATTPMSRKKVEKEALVEELSRSGSTTAFDAKMIEGKASIEGFFMHKVERVSPGHKKVTYRQSDRNLMSTISLLLSTYESLPTVNKNSSLEEIVRHVMRHFSSKLSVTLPDEISNNTMAERYFVIEQLVRTFQASRGNVSRLEYNETEKVIEKIYVSALSLISEISWTSKMPYISSFQTKKDKGTCTMRFNKGNTYRSSFNHGSTLVATTSLTDVTLTRGDFQKAYEVMLENGDLENYFVTAEMSVPKEIVRRIKEEKAKRQNQSQKSHDAGFFEFLSMLEGINPDDSKIIEDIDVREAMDMSATSKMLDLDDIFDGMDTSQQEKSNVLVIVSAPRYMSVSNAKVSHKLLVSALLIANYRCGCIHLEEDLPEEDDEISLIVRSFLNSDKGPAFMVAAGFTDNLQSVAESLRSFCHSRANFAVYDEIKKGNFDDIEMVLFKSPIMGELKDKQSILESKPHIDAVLELDVNPDDFNEVSVFTDIMNKLDGLDITFGDNDYISEGFF
uniref:RNA-directed RNA polymerase L n=1 Tax=BSF uncharacterized bunyavirus-like 1 TaxID=3233090 RepID=A0AAU8MIS4_9VIRU